LLSPGQPPELLAVLAHDLGGRFQANAGGSALVDEHALCGDPSDATSSGVNIDAIPSPRYGRYSAFSAYC
jgi:hypothetical protein